MIRILLLAALAALAGCQRPADPGRPLRLGYFPNITHAQALVGDAGAEFARALGRPVPSRMFNAGPAAMQALLAGDIDVCYVGSAPAVLAYLRSGGEALRVVAGAVSGGAALVARMARSPQDLLGKHVASPQLGNSQDVALRTWLAEHQLPIAGGAGGVRVTPLANGDILALFRRGELEAGWVPEPWAARLAAAGGHILVDERTLWEGGTFPSAVVVASRVAIEKRRPEVIAFLRAHLGLTERWTRDPEVFARHANEALGRITGHPLPTAELRDAFSRLAPAIDPMPAKLAVAAKRAQALGFAPPGDLSRLVDTSLLQQAQEAGPVSAR